MIDDARVAVLAADGGGGRFVGAPATREEERELARLVMNYKEALEVIAACPRGAEHLMPMAAQAALSTPNGKRVDLASPPSSDAKDKADGG